MGRRISVNEDSSAAPTAGAARPNAKRPPVLTERSQNTINVLTLASGDQIQKQREKAVTAAFTAAALATAIAATEFAPLLSDGCREPAAPDTAASHAAAIADEAAPRLSRVVRLPCSRCEKILPAFTVSWAVGMGGVATKVVTCDSCAPRPRFFEHRSAILPHVPRVSLSAQAARNKRSELSRRLSAVRASGKKNRTRRRIWCAQTRATRRLASRASIG